MALGQNAAKIIFDGGVRADDVHHFPRLHSFKMVADLQQGKGDDGIAQIKYGHRVRLSPSSRFANRDALNFDESVKSRRSVMPANAGIQNLLKILDPGFRRDDRKSEFRTFYGAVNFYKLASMVPSNRGGNGPDRTAIAPVQGAIR